MKVLNYCAVASFDKQLHFEDLVRNLDWHFEMENGLLSFGNSFQWRVQILGTESESSGTWRWAWANGGGNIPDALLRSSLTMKALGEQRQIPELTEPEAALDEVDGESLSMIASHECRANAYFRAAYDGGAAYMLIMDDSFPRNTELPLARIACVFRQAISTLEIPNHRPAFLSYLASYGIRPRILSIVVSTGLRDDAADDVVNRADGEGEVEQIA